MSKVAVVYWSGTGNTAAMAEAVAAGAREAGAEVDMFNVGDFNEGMLGDYAAVAFGCSAQGAEVLEEYEFEPVFAECEKKLSGKSIALFGSYGWGDGEWMRSWSARCDEAGANQVAPFVICNEAPDDDAVAACRALGAALAK